MITQEKLKELFEYKDGNLYWKVKAANNTKIGSVAGCKSSRGYVHIRINKKLYYAHRLIFLYHMGYNPDTIDHIDRNNTNNSIENLRNATQQQNCFNRSKSKNTTSRYKGVSWSKASMKWKSCIKIDGKGIELGFFHDPIEAAKMYDKKAVELHGEYAVLNFPDSITSK